MFAVALLEQSGYYGEVFTGGQHSNLSPWLQENKRAYSNLITSFYKNLTSVGQPLFLHNSSLLKLNSGSSMGMVPAVPVGGQLGQLSLEATSLPASADGSGFIVLVLDPLGKLPDLNQTDNMFIQFVSIVNNPALINENMDEKKSPTCSVTAINSGKTYGIDISSFLTVI